MKTQSGEEQAAGGYMTSSGLPLVIVNGRLVPECLLCWREAGCPDVDTTIKEMLAELEQTIRGAKEAA